MKMCTKCFCLANTEEEIAKNHNCENAEIVDIDDAIAPAIESLNKKGWQTRFCCEGHVDGLHPAYVSFKYVKSRHIIFLMTLLPANIFDNFTVELDIKGTSASQIIYEKWTDIKIPKMVKEGSVEYIDGQISTMDLEYDKITYHTSFEVKSTNDILTCMNSELMMFDKSYCITLRPKNEKELLKAFDTKEEEFRYLRFLFKRMNEEFNYQLQQLSMNIVDLNKLHE